MDKFDTEFQRKYEKLRSKCVALAAAAVRYKYAVKKYEMMSTVDGPRREAFAAIDTMADAEKLLDIAIDEARAVL